METDYNGYSAYAYTLVYLGMICCVISILITTLEKLFENQLKYYFKMAIYYLGFSIFSVLTIVRYLRRNKRDSENSRFVDTNMYNVNLHFFLKHSGSCVIVTMSTPDNNVRTLARVDHQEHIRNDHVHVHIKLSFLNFYHTRELNIERDASLTKAL